MRMTVSSQSQAHPNWQWQPLRFANAVGVAAQICLCQAMVEAKKSCFFLLCIYLDRANLATVHHLVTLKCIHMYTVYIVILADLVINCPACYVYKPLLEQCRSKLR